MLKQSGANPALSRSRLRRESSLGGAATSKGANGQQTSQSQSVALGLGDRRQDGGHVGRVDHVLGDQIELAKLDLAGGFKHHLIPVSWVERVDDKHVHLNLTQDEAKARWSEKPH